MKGIFKYQRVFILMLVIVAVRYVGQALGWDMDASPLVMFGMTTLSEDNYFRDGVRSELDEAGRFSRELVTVASGQTLAVLEVIGKVLVGACPTTGTAGGTNTGAGTCTSVTKGTKAKAGIYTLTCIHAVAGYGMFAVVDPDGIQIGVANVGTAFASDIINFTLNDSSPDFALGDSFTITIAAGSGQVKALDDGQDATDGTNDAYGIMVNAVDASGGALSGVAIVRDAVVIPANLVWPTTSPDFYDT